MPDEARDRRNVALKFLSDCWPAQLSKTEFLHQNFSMTNIFHDKFGTGFSANTPIKFLVAFSFSAEKVNKVGLVELPWNVEANHRESAIMS